MIDNYRMDVDDICQSIAKLTPFTLNQNVRVEVKHCDVWLDVGLSDKVRTKPIHVAARSRFLRTRLAQSTVTLLVDDICSLIVLSRMSSKIRRHSRKTEYGIGTHSDWPN